MYKCLHGVQQNKNTNVPKVSLLGANMFSLLLPTECSFYIRDLSFSLNAPSVSHTDRTQACNNPTTLSKALVIQTLYLQNLLYFSAIFPQPGPISFIGFEQNPPINSKHQQVFLLSTEKSQSITKCKILVLFLSYMHLKIFRIYTYF